MLAKAAALAAALLLASGAAAQLVVAPTPAPTPVPVATTLDGFPFSDARASARRQILLSHGINPDGPSLRRFLTEGLPASVLSRPLPQDPEFKADVVLAAIEEIGIRQDLGSAPLLRQLIAREAVPGARATLQIDLERVPVDMIAGTRDRYVRLFSLDAMIAAGLANDTEAAPAILRLIQSETGSRFTTQGAIALALLGRPEGIAPVAALAEKVESGESIAAFETLYVVTGRNYGITAQSSMAKRRAAVKQLLEWLRVEGNSFVPDRKAVLRRRLAALPAPPQPDPASLRGALRRSVDATDQRGRIAARVLLGDLVRANGTAEFRALAEDPMEDTDIRGEALRWLAASEPKAARKTLKRLRSAEEPELAEMARTLLEKIN